MEASEAAGTSEAIRGEDGTRGSPVEVTTVEAVELVEATVVVEVGSSITIFCGITWCP